MTLKTLVEKEGQRYVDEPIYAHPKLVPKLDEELAVAFGHRLSRPITLGHERVKLRWLKPDGNGGFVER